MNFFRNLHQFMMVGARAQAHWELEMSNNILRSRKRLAIIGLLLIPILLGGIAFADSVGGALPSFLGGKSAYGPSHYTNLIFGASILVGLCAGLITGCIGAGGGFIIAPALMSVGVKGILAVGTDLFHIFAKAIMGSVLHRKMGNISVALAVTFLIGAISGSTVGGYINRALYDKNPVLSDMFITIIYVLMLGFLAFYALADWYKTTRRKTAKSNSQGEGPATQGEEVPPIGKMVQSINLPPMLTFDKGVTPGGRKISAFFLIIAGFIVGLAAAIMGVGGGFLTFPIFVYGLGVSSMTTVGTDIFQIVFTAGYGSITQYAIYGFIFYTLAMGMLLGSLIGIQVGSIVTKVVSGTTICAFYAITVSAGFFNRACALPSKLVKMGYLDVSPQVLKVLNTIGTYGFFCIIIIFAVWVFWSFFTNLNVLRAEEVQESWEMQHN
ncbi:sulfite exporter TauE/SafE family protein [Desulfogranum japonicum]|uniref:sulfite exporter TauE/SafE family protein n=1 Tax=Desulfogranum japonicum TaxID=231447 RepID=UPI00040E556A|nr:sulfite exporter TauE/SafE family protein [Desulfogranum japonicum]